MGNMVGFAFDKVKEGLSWLVSLVSPGIDSCFRKLKEAFTWAISKIKKFFSYLFNWMNNLRDLLGHDKEFINMVCEAERITGQRLKLVPFGKDEQKKIGNILSDLQKSCLPFLAALSKLEELEKIGFPLPEEFEEERIDGFFPNKFES